MENKIVIDQLFIKVEAAGLLPSSHGSLDQHGFLEVVSRFGCKSLQGNAFCARGERGHRLRPFGGS